MFSLPFVLCQLSDKAAELDASDPLRHFRDRFSLPAPVYLCGNSLGAQPRAVREALQRHVDKWASQAVAGHFSQPSPWSQIEDEAARLYMPLVGAKSESEVAVMNSLTTNLHLLMTAFYAPRGKRNVILVEDGAFSSDEYAWQTHVRTRGLQEEHVIHRLKPRKGEVLLRDDDIVSVIHELAMSGTLALIILPGVQYYTGQVFPMQKACEAARKVGVPIGFDLAHAVGNVKIDLHDWGADFAVWCSYKYINGGPGAIAGAFLHEKYADADLPRLGGWWGHERESRFVMPREFVPQRGIRGFQLSNPPVMAVVPVAAALGEFDKAGMDRLRKKGIALSGFLIETLDKVLGEEVEVVSPREEERRGCQVSLRMRGWNGMRQVNERLEKMGVVCDVREPDVLRVAPAPLYNSFTDVVQFVKRLEDVVRELRIVDKAHAHGL